MLRMLGAGVGAVAMGTGQAGVGIPTGRSMHNAVASLLVNALEYGIAADGITNDAPAWNRLVASLEGTGATVTWVGRSLLRGRINWKRGVSLVGEGWGRSVFVKTTDHSPASYFSAIGWTPGYSSEEQPFADLTFADFEIDGSGVVGPGPAIHDKAIFMQHLVRCTFRNLYLHDTVGTALGTDFMSDCLIVGVVARNAGRGWDGIQGGHAGIGIGQGMAPVESVLISNCHAIDCGHWGIFVERQVEGPFVPRGAQIVECTATGTAGSGFGDYGCASTLFLRNTSTHNGLAGNSEYRDGITITQGAIGTRVRENSVTGNAGDGICIKSSAGSNVLLAGNQVHMNAGHGIVSQLDGVFSAHSFRSNECSQNRLDGIRLGGAHTSALVLGNRAWNNGHGTPTPTASGIALTGEFAETLVGGNHCYDDQGVKTQAYGIAILSGSYTATRIATNDVAGNAVSSVHVDRARLKSIDWADNTGSLTRSTGRSKIRVNKQFIRVEHNLMAKPTNVTLDDDDQADAWVSRIDSTGFRINRKKRSRKALRARWTAVIESS